MKSVEDVYSQGLCCGCGACKIVCNLDAISIKESNNGFLHSKVDKRRCIGCGKCLKVCPGEKLYLRKNLSDVVGSVRKAYIGYATDETTRLNGQSGGIITAIIASLLETNTVKKAWVNIFDENVNRNRFSCITKAEELIKSEGSYYAQTNLPDAELSNSVITVLGCQAEALRCIKSEGYIIGLFCAGNHSRKYYDCLEHIAYGEYEEKVKEFRFRDKKNGGWPGNVQIKTDIRNYEIPAQIRMRQKTYYKCFRCDLCSDIFNLNGDISVGDPWGLELDEAERKAGMSVILVRSDKGQEMIDIAVREHKIVIQEIDVNKIVNGQGIDDRYLKNKINAIRLFEKRKTDLALCEICELKYHKMVSTGETDIYKAKAKYGRIVKKIMIIRRIKHCVDNIKRKTGRKEELDENLNV